MLDGQGATPAVRNHGPTACAIRCPGQCHLTMPLPVWLRCVSALAINQEGSGETPSNDNLSTPPPNTSPSVVNEPKVYADPSTRHREAFAAVWVNSSGASLMCQ